MKRLGVTYILACVVAILLFATGVLRNGTMDYWYLPYNLLLGVIPLLLAIGLERVERIKKQLNWQIIFLTVLWLLFLPNSFYILTDFIHLPETKRVDIVQDVIMLTQFSILGLAAGFYSLLIIHKVYLKYIANSIAAAGVATILFLSSLAIFLGRELRWNSWDLIVHPVEVLADCSAVLFFPFAHADAWSMILSFLGMLGTLYLLLWQLPIKIGNANRAGAKKR